MKRRARSKDKSGLPRAGVLSLLFHIALIIILGLSAKLVITKVVPSVYRVAIMPFSPPGDGLPKGGPGLTPPAQDQPVPPAAEKPKTEGTQKPAEVVATVKPEQKKPEKKVEKPPKADVSLVPKKQTKADAKKEEQLAQAEESDRSLQEAIEEIHRKVAEREGAGQGSGGAGKGSPQGPTVGTVGGGAGSGIGSGTGSGGGTPEQGYPSMVKARIKQEWALTANFPKGKSQLKTIIVFILERDGKIQKAWFKQRSGNDSYDQMAMRAIKKAEPLPPFPQGFDDNTFEFCFGCND
jgi:colicin import membrane protein